jgi:hypothetical protein
MEGEGATAPPISVEFQINKVLQDHNFLNSAKEIIKIGKSETNASIKSAINALRKVNLFPINFFSNLCPSP